ncbi:MAG TPA: thymidine phosphorylase [bacterium]|nr:thymidine phosphorylase [bacterium]HPR88441.1 thymidine phosphorylase [bacterium]
MTANAIIARKRDGFALNPEEIQSLISAYVQGTIPDYQMSAWLMAVYLRGMDARETATLTQAFLDSGARLDLGDIPGRKIDKHSTGGVGDKVSLILAPLMAAVGVRVPMISGRSLGHTGGTLDKLEAIPGFRTDLSPQAFHDQVADLGVAMIGQTDDLVPADKKIYALRDSTATIDSIPLITASILSKKLAEDLDGLVMDIKCGRGAFMREMSQAEALAHSILRTAALHRLPAVAVITDMDQPLGYAVGNWLEVREVLQSLQGHGPEDLMQVTYALGAQMLQLAGYKGTAQQAMSQLQKAIISGAALQRFERMVAAQGGETRVLRDPGSYPGARLQQHFRAPRSGFVTEIDALRIGEAVIRLGGGRMTKADRIDPATGVILGKKRGDEVSKGEVLAIIHASQPAAASAALELVRKAFVIATQPAPLRRTILKIMRE